MSDTNHLIEKCNNAKLDEDNFWEEHSKKIKPQLEEWAKKEVEYLNEEFNEWYESKEIDNEATKYMYQVAKEQRQKEIQTALDNFFTVLNLEHNSLIEPRNWAKDTFMNLINQKPLTSLKGTADEWESLDTAKNESLDCMSVRNKRYPELYKFIFSDGKIVYVDFSAVEIYDKYNCRQYDRALVFELYKSDYFKVGFPYCISDIRRYKVYLDIDSLPQILNVGDTLTVTKIEALDKFGNNWTCQPYLHYEVATKNYINHIVGKYRTIHATDIDSRRKEQILQMLNDKFTIGE